MHVEPIRIVAQIGAPSVVRRRGEKL